MKCGNIRYGYIAMYVLFSLLGVQSVYVDADNDLVLVETTLSSSHVQELLQATGKLVLFRGIGNATEVNVPSAAVAIFCTGEVKGVIRIAQIDNQHCVLEGTVDGLQPGPHQVRVRQYGDLSEGSSR